MDTTKISQILRISKMYYELNMGQVEIAEKEGISKSSVSRLLKNAMDIGLIEVRVKESVLSYSELEKELTEKFPLRRAVIVPDLVGNRQVLLQDVCGALAEDLHRFLKNDSILGVHWGHTLAVLAKQLPSLRLKGVSVIQLSGGFSRAVYESGALDILKNFVDCVNGTGYQIPAPAMVDQSFIADAIKQDGQIKEILDMADRCHTAIFSVGNLERPSVLYEMGVINEDSYREIREMGGIGDCCSHFIDKSGNVLDEKLDSRVIATPLSVIKKIPNKMLIAVGKEKTEVIIAALKGGLADSLYIDAPTAEEILKQYQG
ncbi:sugar-binding domain-containing protein [Proteiniclasticum sp.]|uniref:sugar-binding transcriptional regulator n=1 Tax=Proteiniclasticum sp. TaxID=2053595 RepID=UPI00289FD549|nr:sugar-binding domain-containing protein [Proteiniclasticum sp.]